MSEKVINEKFENILSQEKHVIIEKLGKPLVSTPSFLVYQKNNKWMVIFFKDILDKKIMKSQISAIAFYNDDLSLSWCKGVNPLSNARVIDNNDTNDINSFVGKYGIPHAQYGEMNTSLYYLTDNGCFLIANCEKNKIVGVKLVKLSELAS